MCAKKYTKDSKEFQIMKEFFAIMKQFGSIDSDEKWAEYEKAAKDFIKDENPAWEKYKNQLIASWTEKLKKDQEEKMQMMMEYYRSMQEYAVMESDEDWEKAVDHFGESAKKYRPSMQEVMRMFSIAWLDKLGADYNKTA